MVRMGWADKQEVKALKAVSFGADGVIPGQSHGCERSPGPAARMTSSEVSGLDFTTQ